MLVVYRMSGAFESGDETETSWSITGPGMGGVGGVGAVVLGTVGTGAAGVGAGADAGFGGTNGAPPFFMASIRSNSPMLFGVVGCGCAAAAGFAGCAFGVIEIGGAGGVGFVGVIAPSFTTGSCDACFDHPAPDGGLIGVGCGAGDGETVRFELSGVVFTPIPDPDWEMICGFAGCGTTGAGIGLGGTTEAMFGFALKLSERILGPGAEEIMGEISCSDEGAGAYAAIKSSRSAAKIFVSSDLEISAAAAAGRLSSVCISFGRSSEWINPKRTRPVSLITTPAFSSSR